MHRLDNWPVAARAGITGVFTDIDDTLTTDGAITPDALEALSLLKAAGMDIIAITGRPVGWSEPFAQAWPVDAIVAENGAVLLHLSHETSAEPLQSLPTVLSKSYQQDAPTRRANLIRLQQAAARVLREVPGTTLARDTAGRETDIAIDHSEFVHLSAVQVADVAGILQSEGLHATVSSIHINGWIGEHNKLTGARWAVRTLLGRDLTQEMDRWVFVGDSTNDQLMFEAFEHSVGVANVRRFESQLSGVNRLPRYVTVGERGAGFSELAAALLAARNAKP